MELKEFLYKRNFEDIKEIFLLYNISHKPSGITAIRKNAYTLNDLKFDCRENLKLIFSNLSNRDFNNLWNKISNELLENRISVLNDLGLNAAKLIYRINKKTMLDFIINKISKLNKKAKNLLTLFLKDGPENTKDYTVEYKGKRSDFYVKFGLLYRGSYCDSNGVLVKNDYYYYPLYFSNLRLSALEKLNLGKIQKEKKKINLFTKTSKRPSSTKQEIYKLKVIEIGKKGKKKFKFGISKFNVGAQFGGDEQKTLKIICGSCGKSDKFIIEDKEKNLLRCVKCGELNQPMGREKKYFK